MKILLHTCCAACAIHPAKVLKEAGWEVEFFFYNPNIHPREEYEKRKATLEKLASREAWKVHWPDYRDEEFFEKIPEPLSPRERCPLCWNLRLKETAVLAARRGFTAFSTTLLASPYQDQDLIREIALGLAAKSGVKFYFDNFRSGFREAHNLAKAQGLYLQKYCGCRYSLKEREESIARRQKGKS